MLSVDVIIFTLHMYYRSQIIRVRDVKVVALLSVTVSWPRLLCPYILNKVKFDDPWRKFFAFRQMD